MAVGVVQPREKVDFIASLLYQVRPGIPEKRLASAPPEALVLAQHHFALPALTQHLGRAEAAGFYRLDAWWARFAGLDDGHRHQVGLCRLRRFSVAVPIRHEFTVGEDEHVQKLHETHDIHGVASLRGR